MKTLIIKSLTILVLAGTIASCGESKKDAAGTLNDKKAALIALQKQYADIGTQIDKLEEEIATLDTTAIVAGKLKLVAVSEIAPVDFSHYIELQGRVDADNISYVTPRGGPGQVSAIYIQKGDYVKRGQKVLKLDDRIILQQIEQLKTQLAFAQDLLQRRENLWKQNIGSEVELLSAKNNVTQLERQISTLKEQWNMTNVMAEVDGYVDDVLVKVGEIFQGGPQIRIVNTSSLKVMTDIPENYASRVGRGSKLLVNVPDINKEFTTSVSFVSSSINPASRGFIVEGRLPADKALKPNQIAMVKILDYNAPNAIAVPITVVQTDEKGKYVFVMTNEQGKSVARKKPVAIGQVQGTEVEIKVGLAAGDKLISEGFQGLYDGQVVTTSTI